MANVRGKNQTLITCPIDADLLEELDGARGRISRSQFIREAIAEKLRGMGLDVSEDIVFPPDRVSISARVSGTGNKLTQKNLSSTSNAPARKLAKPSRGKRNSDK
jgi:hypothetical protein